MIRGGTEDPSMRIGGITRATAAALALLLVGAVALAEHHEDTPAEPEGRKPWNQEEMTDLSGRLARALRDVRSAYRKEPGYRDPGNPNRRAAQRMDETLRALEKSATQLHNQVKAGAGYEGTQGTARKIGSLLNDADVEGRKLMTSTWMDQRVQPAMVLINEIAPYYGSGPLYDPETMQRLDRPPDPSRGEAPSE